MFSVIFEVQPKPDKFDEYLNLAKELKPILEGIEGFIDNERFESKRTKGRVLSLSTWAGKRSLPNGSRLSHYAPVRRCP